MLPKNLLKNLSGFFVFKHYDIYRVAKVVVKKSLRLLSYKRVFHLHIGMFDGITFLLNRNDVGSIPTHSTKMNVELLKWLIDHAKDTEWMMLLKTNIVHIVFQMMIVDGGVVKVVTTKVVNM